MSTITNMATDVPELCTDIFFFVTSVRSAKSFGTFDYLHKLVNGLFEPFLEDDKRTSTAIPKQDPAAFQRFRELPAGEREDIRLALAALVDDTILFESGYPQEVKDSWRQNLIELRACDTDEAGDIFFVRLEQLLGDERANPAVIEIFHTCLALGFQGKWREKADKLNGFIRRTRDKLGLRDDAASSIQPPHAESRDKVEAPWPDRLAPWLRGICYIVIIVAIVLVLYFAVRLRLSAGSLRRSSQSQDFSSHVARSQV